MFRKRLHYFINFDFASGKQDDRVLSMGIQESHVRVQLMEHLPEVRKCKLNFVAKAWPEYVTLLIWISGGIALTL